MHPPADASEVYDLLVRVNLVDVDVARDCLSELDDRKAPPEELIRMMERRRILTPLQGSKLLKGDTDGYFCGSYRLLYKIASGTFGRVYRGDDPRSGQIVAIKVLRKRWTEDAKRVDSFEREGRLGLALDHPNIVRILAVSQDPLTRQHYMVMEFVEGGNLKDILNIRKQIEVLEALRIMEECAAGLAYAHNQGLSHRDIKASNILLGTDKVAKLVDFGLAGIHEGAAQVILSKPGGDKGDKEEQEAGERTVDYAGLERATNVKQGDLRSDVYFLGHVLYEMLMGIPLMPHTRDRHARMARRRFEDVAETLSKAAQEYDMPPPLFRLIAKAVELDPTQRYQTAAAFQEAIQQCRKELEGGTEEGEAAVDPRRAEGPLTIFVLESNAKLQDVFRAQFKKMGFRVLISLDAEQAIKRYQTQPYHALVVDAGSVDQSGVEAYRRVTIEANAHKLDLSAVLILNEEQKLWAGPVKNQPGGTIFIRPVTMKQLAEAVRKHVPELHLEDEV